MADHWKEHHITLCRIGITLDHNLHKKISASSSCPTSVFYLQNLECIFSQFWFDLCPIQIKVAASFSALSRWIWHHHNNCKRKRPKCYTQACGTAVSRKQQINTCTTRRPLLHTIRFCLDSETSGQQSQDNFFLQNLQQMSQNPYNEWHLCSLPPLFQSTIAPTC